MGASKRPPLNLVVKMNSSCSDAATLSLGDRLSSTCIFDEDYSPFRWNYAVSLIVVLFWFMLARYLYDGYYRLVGLVPDFKLAEHLTKRDNPALAIQFAAFMFSIGIITRGSLNSLPVEVGCSPPADPSPPKVTVPMSTMSIVPLAPTIPTRRVSLRRARPAPTNSDSHRNPPQNAWFHTCSPHSDILLLPSPV